MLINAGHITNGLDSFSIMDVKDILRFGRETMMDILESWELIRHKNPGEENVGFPFVYRMEKEIKNSISEISNKIDTYQEKMETRVDTVIAKILTDLPLQERLNQKLHMIDQYVSQINDLYQNFLKFVETHRKYEKYTLEDFARTCVSSRSGALPDLLKSIHRLFVPSSDNIFSRSVLVLLANQMKVSSNKISNLSYFIFLIKN